MTEAVCYGRYKGNPLFDEQVWSYLADYFRDQPERFCRLYQRVGQAGSFWVPSFSLPALLAGPAWFGYRRHYAAMNLSMIVINSMLLIGYFSDNAGLLFVAMMTAAGAWAFCGLYARSLVLASAVRFIRRTLLLQAEPLLQKRAVWRAGGVDPVTAAGVLAGQVTMMFPLGWELVNGPILLWPII